MRGATAHGTCPHSQGHSWAELPAALSTQRSCIAAITRLLIIAPRPVAVQRGVNSPHSTAWEEKEKTQSLLLTSENGKSIFASLTTSPCNALLRVMTAITQHVDCNASPAGYRLQGEGTEGFVPTVLSWVSH